ncbi:prepilin-type cleavage/methylation-like protein [Oceanimonas sp. CHS3-5]|uniref:prepilin-type cleavage/methylation-like protein n=1 Tax=Oceanimonas sp. CHS3-5 TaxID=3068186 RepID=UPI00273D91E9|nr:prepilin-type cleavage/methylation-like protein [Oceanimonas sp. CHS3-5]MDP5291772.1 prepilin-type cleavage/methylation-like protein [Oceanimonas sp. CHS3-5]
MLRRNAGLSLLEYVVGLAVLAIILVGAGLFFLSQPRQLDPVFQFRAVALAEALAEQVLAVKYDEKNKPDEQERCSTDCTKEEDFGPDGSESELTDFDDVDDFHLWCGDENAISGDVLAGEEQLNLSHATLYSRYKINTCVEEKSDGSADYKKVIITIADKSGSDISFILHRYNIR